MRTPHRASGVIGGRFGRYLGAALLVQFALLLVIKIDSGLTHEICWMSHVGLLMAGVGLCCRSTLLVTTALTVVLFPHTIWLVDCAAWLTCGRFPLGLTRYLAESGFWTWLGTAHHFYLAPLLIILSMRHRAYPAEALLAGIAVCLVLTVTCRALLPPSENINFAFGLNTTLDWSAVIWVNRLPGDIYLLFINGFMVCVMFLPVTLIMRHLCREHAPSGPDRPGSSTSRADRYR